MELSPAAPHPINVNALATIPKTHEELKEQYVIALHLLSDARFAYGVTSVEAISATRLVEGLERQLAEHPAAKLGLYPS